MQDDALCRRATACDPTDVADVARLRKHASAAEAAVALDLAKARRKAAAKFPKQADTLVADAAGVEQATSLRVARHKARRFADAGIHRVTDLCCGVGGDAMGLVEAGLDVAAVDQDPVRAWMAGRNAGCETRVADAAESLSAPTTDREAGLHLDPARRTDAGRIYRLADHRPGPDTLRRLLDRFPHTALKLSPAVNLDELAAELPPGGAEVEFISEGGRLVQSVVWTGPGLVDPAQPRRATLVLADRTHTLTGPPQGAELAAPGRYLFAADPAAERAGLLGRFGMPLIHPRLGLFTGDSAGPADDPWLTGFELLAELPWHPGDPRQVRRWLADHRGGHVEVKTRGKAVDPDRAQKQLRGTGDNPFTVFVLRFDQRLAALVTRRL